MPYQQFKMAEIDTITYSIFMAKIFIFTVGQIKFYIWEDQYVTINALENRFALQSNFHLHLLRLDGSRDTAKFSIPNAMTNQRSLHSANK